MAKGIRVFIVDVSLFFREFLSRSLALDPAIEVAGTASDATDALRKIPAAQPDIITLEIEMPAQLGMDFLRQFCAFYPAIKVIVVSSSIRYSAEVISAGALSFVAKPNTRSGYDNTAFVAELTARVKTACGVVAPAARPAPAFSPPSHAAPATPVFRAGAVRFPNPKSVVAIGASTGGTEAILAVVKDLPEDCPGVVIVQHMPPVFTKMYAERLDKNCKMTVREAQNGDRVERGLILIAAGDKHMRLRSDFKGYYVRCEEGEKVSGHCPSVDALFESVAQTAGSSAVGVILTGMGADGAKNLLVMRKSGAHTIGQNKETCVVYGMPMEAFNMGAVAEQLPLKSITEAILRKLAKG